MRSRIEARATIARSPADAGAEAVDDALGERVVTLDHEQRGAEDRAVDGDQRQEDAEGAVERREESVQCHLDDLHHRGDRADIAQEAEEGKVVPGQVRADPGDSAPFAQQVVVDESCWPAP